VSKKEIDDYLATLKLAERETLEILRHDIMEIVPDAEQCISYGIPAFRLRGKVIAGFGAYKQHLSYFPHSGSVLEAFKSELAAYSRAKGTLHFRVDSPLPKALVKRLIQTRIDQAFNTE